MLFLVDIRRLLTCTGNPLLHIHRPVAKSEPKVHTQIGGAAVESGASTLILDVEREVMIDRASVLKHVYMNMIDKH
jgi:hypothetical protein